MANMSVTEQLNYKLKEAYMKGSAFFIVMNKITSQRLIKELISIAPINIIPAKFMNLAKYEDLDILISESLKDNEFRIG